MSATLPPCHPELQADLDGVLKIVLVPIPRPVEQPNPHLPDPDHAHRIRQWCMDRGVRNEGELIENWVERIVQLAGKLEDSGLWRGPRDVPQHTPWHLLAVLRRANSETFFPRVTSLLLRRARRVAAGRRTADRVCGGEVVPESELDQVEMARHDLREIETNLRHAIHYTPAEFETFKGTLLQAILEAIRSPNRAFLDGDQWHLAYGSEEGVFKANKGMNWLVSLLRSPHHRFTVADLRGDTEGKLASDARIEGELETDQEGATKIKDRLGDIEDTIATTGGNEVLEDEKVKLLSQLRRIDNRRRIKSPLQKAHHNIATQLRTVRDDLSKVMPSFAAHLKVALHLEIPNFIYSPPPNTPAWDS